MLKLYQYVILPGIVTLRLLISKSQILPFEAPATNIDFIVHSFHYRSVTKLHKVK